MLTLFLPLFFPEDIDETHCSHMIDPYYIVVYCIFEIHIIPYHVSVYLMRSESLFFIESLIKPLRKYCVVIEFEFFSIGNVT